MEDHHADVYPSKKPVARMLLAVLLLSILALAGWKLYDHLGGEGRQAGTDYKPSNGSAGRRPSGKSRVRRDHLASKPAKADKLPIDQADKLLIDRADTLLIDDDGDVVMLGEIGYSLGENGRYTGRMTPFPAGPVIVYVFRRIGPAYEAKLRAAGAKVKEGGAYLYDREAPLDMKYIGNVDVKLSNPELAAKFRVGIYRMLSPD